MCVVSTVSSYGLDLWFNRQMGLKNWFFSIVYDTTCVSLSRTPSAKKDEDLVVVEAEDDVNGESVRREMDKERRLQRARAWLSGLALSVGVVGLWGDKK